MQHEPWIGPDYEQGIEGARVLIAAYSHWSDEPDTVEFTKREVRAWAGGDEPEPFGPRLRAFSDIKRPPDFWSLIFALGGGCLVYGLFRMVNRDPKWHF